MNCVKEYWNKIDEFYEHITPKCEKCKAVEEKIKCPLKYILMGVTILLLLIFFLLTRKCGFYNYIAFFPALFATMKSVYEKKDEYKKWSCFWFIYACFMILPKCFEKNIIYNISKAVILLYLAFFDQCTIVITGMETAYEYMKKGFDFYEEKCCGCEKKED